MKKITLLLVAAIFAIGIQGCSTEEEILVEENTMDVTDAQQKNRFDMYAEWEDKVFVFYSESLSNTQKNAVRNLMKQNVYSTLTNVPSNACFNREMWDVKSHDKNLFSASGLILPKQANVTEVMDENEEDETVIIDHLNKQYYNQVSKIIIGNFKIVQYNSVNIPVPCAGYYDGFN
ncbi:hypothetical protein GCM10009430_47010 [Aquimarina litoralis]|uniref:Uncharacterized protein n=1 Tax=Aquimarina litoralis TaxID=584605 RepID=A0ABP3UFZ8_9FLAO